jgi:hypothetical protein
VRTNLGQVDKTVDLAQQVIVRDAPLKAEAVEQRLLHHPPFAHHRPNLLHPREENQRPAPQSSGVFQRYWQIAVVHLAATRANCPVCLMHRFATVVRDCRLGKELVPKHLCFGKQRRAKLSRALLILVTGHTSIIKWDKQGRLMANPVGHKRAGFDPKPQMGGPDAG